MELSPVSRNTQRRKAKVNELADELAIGAAMRLRVESDSIRPVVDAVVAYLVDQYPAQDLYIPRSSVDKVDPSEVASILVDIKRGLSVRTICKKYQRDRRSIYRLIDA
jgi:hypothetical protein